MTAFIYTVLSGVNVIPNLEKMGIGISNFFKLQISVVTLILSILVFEVINVGVCRFFVENRDYNAPSSKLFFGFGCGHYANVMGTMFLMSLKIFLWSLLLFIPGIIKSYEYRMVPYILAEQPDISSSRALSISSEMMMGNKADAFVMDLSFLGWHLLGAITCGLTEIFWTRPYELAAYTELYVTLRDNWLSRMNR